LDVSTEIIAGFVLEEKEGDDQCYAWLAVENCPFYPESGGQVLISY
jgi:hypothetical protein